MSLVFTGDSFGRETSVRAAEGSDGFRVVRSFVDSPDSRPLSNCRKESIIEGRLRCLRPRFSFAPRFRHARVEAECARRRDPRPIRPDHRTTHVPAVAKGSGLRFVLDPLAGGRVQQASGRRKPFCVLESEVTIWDSPEACGRREDWWFGGRCHNACCRHRGHPCLALHFAYEHGCRRPARESHQVDDSSGSEET